MDKVRRFREIVNEMADLYEKKNKNYGNSFGKLFEDLGSVAGLVPLHNKLDRATNLIKGGKNDFESLEDTFKDLACYAIMNLIEMEAKENEKPDSDKNYTCNDYYEKWLNPKLHGKPCDRCKRNKIAWNGIISPCQGCVFYEGDTVRVTNTTSTKVYDYLKNNATADTWDSTYYTYGGTVEHEDEDDNYRGKNEKEGDK